MSIEKSEKSIERKRKGIERERAVSLLKYKRKFSMR